MMAASHQHTTPSTIDRRVCVLLSTFNGEGHLEEQLKSLEAQEGAAVHLHVRDDGSTDGTIGILKRHADVWPHVAAVMPNANLGPARSFLELLRSAPNDFDHYAFCDQDDVWLPRKLMRAVDAIVNDRGPTLYCSGVICVTEDLRELGRPLLGRNTNLPHLLFENVVAGCTVVMNRAARDLIVAHLPERGVIMHDWWCALVVAALGRIRYDPEPQVLYRQHAGNVLGTNTNRLGEVFSHARRFLGAPRRFYPIREQAEEFLRLYGESLPPQIRAPVERLVLSSQSLRARARYALSRDIVRQRGLDSIIARGLVVAGWY